MDDIDLKTGPEGVQPLAVALVVDHLVRQTAIKILAARAISTRAMAVNIPSPCVSICRMDTHSGVCDGCFRTIDEICVWSQSDDMTKKAIWTTLSQRLRQAHPNAFANESLP